MASSKRFSVTLNPQAIVDGASAAQSYEIQHNKLALRAFLFSDGKIYTNGGECVLSAVSADDIVRKSATCVARGASGAVYHATTKNGETVALKYIPINSKSRRDEVERELSFFQSVSQNPFVMRNLGAFYDSTENAIVIPMEWMEYTVSDLAEFWKGMDELVLKSIFVQVVRGLRYLHDEKRVIHRDLKPTNLLIRSDGYVKIGDFGVSKLVQTLDVSSTYVGTMVYMAPERLEEGAHYGFSSDVWSLGLTFIAASTGINPWGSSENMNLFQLLSLISSGDVPKLSEKYSPEAQDFAKVCLQRDPESRPRCVDLLEHPFLKSCEEKEAVQNVHMAITHMTQLLKQQAKQHQTLKRSDKDFQEALEGLLGGITKS